MKATERLLSSSPIGARNLSPIALTSPRVSWVTGSFVVVHSHSRTASPWYDPKDSAGEPHNRHGSEHIVTSIARGIRRLHVCEWLSHISSDPNTHDSPDDLVLPPLAARRDRRVTEVWQHFGTEQLDRAQHLPLRQAGKAKGAKDMLNARSLHLLEALDHHLRRTRRGGRPAWPGSSRRSRSRCRWAQAS